jgi:preprotein translocase subunit SecD
MLSSLRKYANDNKIPIDGVVIAKDSIELSNSLGRTEKFFRHSIAYKFEDERYETELEDIEVSARYGQNAKLFIFITTMVIVVASIVVMGLLFKELGLVSSLSMLFALMMTVIISAIFDLQVTIGGWLGFIVGYLLNFLLHLYYLNVIKNEYAIGKKFSIAFTSGYKKYLFNTLDILLITLGTALLMLVVPSSAVKFFSFNLMMTLAGTAFTSLLLNKIVCVNYTAFNLKDEKKVNFVREENVDEI